MKYVVALAAACAAAFAAPAFANQQLAQQKNCMACHAVDKKLVGPSYKDVAAKYAGQKDAVDKLAQKVLKGGSGAWGQVPMPANPGERGRGQATGPVDPEPEVIGPARPMPGRGTAPRPVQARGAFFCARRAARSRRRRLSAAAARCGLPASRRPSRAGC